MRLAGWAVIFVALTVGAGCVQSDWIDRMLVTVDVTGVWRGTFTTTGGGSSSGEVELELQQRGAKVTGVMKSSASTPGMPIEGTPIEGTVAGDTFSFHERSGLSIQGELQVNGDEMTGS
jgi:hypothetical protein